MAVQPCGSARTSRPGRPGRTAIHATTAPHLPRLAAGFAALRVGGVLLVLLGVLAMHAVAGGSHMAGMIRPAPAAVPPGASAAVGQPTGRDAMPTSAAHAATALQSVDLAGEHPGVAAAAAAGVTSGTGVGSACVAVLFGLLLLAARTAAVTARPAAVPALRGPRHGSAPLGRGPPRQLLAQLCVLRT